MPVTVEPQPGNAVAVGVGVAAGTVTVAVGPGVVAVGVGNGVVPAVGNGVAACVAAGVAGGTVGLGVGPGIPETIIHCVEPLQTPTGSALIHVEPSVIPVTNKPGELKDETATLV